MKKLILTSILCFLLLSCKKDKLTKATQIGANTFSCKVNGQVYIPKDEAFSANGIDISLNDNSEDPSFFNLRILTSGPQFTPARQLYIIINKIKQSGKYQLNESNFRYGQYFTLFHDNKEYNTKVSNRGEVTIAKFDLANKVISGTFSFEAVNTQNTSDKVSITDGRFDLKLNINLQL